MNRSSLFRGVKRTSVLTTALVGLVMLPAAPALAAPPANDEPAGAVALSLGGTVTQDTTEATTGAGDASALEFCDEPAIAKSVWYSYTPAADGSFVLQAGDSDFAVGLAVFEGAPTADSLLNCGPFSLGQQGVAGTTYTIMVWDFDAGTGGNLILSLAEAPPPPTVDLSVDPVGVARRDGSATITGSYSCANADFIDVFASLSQSVGRFTIRGFGGFFDEGTCDGTSHPFSIDIFPDNGKFAGGRAASVTFAFACGALECNEFEFEQTIRLTRAR
jgi:hypothetical protein